MQVDVFKYLPCMEGVGIYEDTIRQRSRFSNTLRRDLLPEIIPDGRTMPRGSLPFPSISGIEPPLPGCWAPLLRTLQSAEEASPTRYHPITVNILLV